MVLKSVLSLTQVVSGQISFYYISTTGLLFLLDNIAKIAYITCWI